jgi:hypothetical protein
MPRLYLYMGHADTEKFPVVCLVGWLTYHSASRLQGHPQKIPLQPPSKSSQSHQVLQLASNISMCIAESVRNLKLENCGCEY